MPRIPVHTIDDAPEASRPALQALARRMGRVLNIHGEMAHAPAVVGAYQALQRALAEHGTLDARTREAIAPAVSAVARCDYWQSAHTISAQRAGLSAEQTVQLRGGEVSVDHRLAALVGVVRQVTANVGFVDEAMVGTELDIPAAPPLPSLEPPTIQVNCVEGRDPLAMSS